MTEHQFLSNSFFENLNSHNFQEQLSDARDLINTAQTAEVENKKFITNTSRSFIVVGVIMMLIGVLTVFSKEIGMVFLMIGLAVVFPWLLQVLNYHPDKSIKKKLQKFQKVLSQGLKKPQNKLLARSKNDAMIFGVFAGFAKYLGIPVWILRFIAISLLFVSGGSILILYFALAFSLPEEQSLPELED